METQMSDNIRCVGTVSRGIRCPIIREGDDLAAIVAESVLKAAESEGFSLRDRDIIAVTESVVARSQGNYATVEQIAAAADSFNYEFVCGISRRVPRIYMQGGRVVNEVRYLLDT